MTEKTGKLVKGLGGLFETRLDSGERVVSRAKGNLKRENEKLQIGDIVKISYTDTEGGVVISEILPRKNSLIRPPVSNLDYIFAVFATKKPVPVLETVDKLISIAEYNGISPVVVITKSDLDNSIAEEYYNIYKNAGFDVFITSGETKEGIDELRLFINKTVRDGKTAAFAGASGVGKSTLMNSLFPNLSLLTSQISEKIERGKHTTRHVEIFDIGDGGFLADTPGFSMMDFARFDFFPLSALESTFRDFLGYRTECRYSDCRHFKEGEDECAVLRAVRDGKIAESRLNSYRSIYAVLKEKSAY